MKTKFNLDRDKVKSEYIHSKQDYKKVLDGFQALKPPIWKNPWFYGPVGLASLATILVLTFQLQVNAYGNNTTLNLTSNTDINFPEDTPCIKAPISNHDIEFQMIEVYPENGIDTLLVSGTTINIPANSLKSEAGEPVQLKIREFRDKSSAFLAGIPMDFGNNSAFESAGMIEIRAEKNGKQVLLTENKPMEVNLALFKSPETFKFWKLNEDKKKWEETPCIMQSAEKKSTRDHLAIVDKKIEIKEAVIEKCEKEIATINGREKAELVKAMIPTENARKLIIDFDSRDYPELKGYKDLEFEYILPENKSEASIYEYSKRINYAQAQVWNDVDIKKQGDRYIATFINSKEKYSLPIRPILKGQSLTAMQAKMADAAKEKKTVLQKIADDKKAAEMELEKLRKEQRKLMLELKEQLRKSEEQMANMERKASENRARAAARANTIQAGTASFRTTSFGVYNCDKPLPYPPECPILLVFETKEGQKIQMESAFVFDLKKNTRYSFGGYYPHSKEKLGWFNDESTLVIIDDKGEVYFKQKVNEQTKSTGKLVVHRLDKKDVTLDNIQSIIREATSIV